MAQDNATLRGKIYAMKEYVSNAELESKASRETIMRLVAETEKEQHMSSKVTYEIESLKMVCTASFYFQFI